MAVYFVRAGDTDSVKIGYAIDVQARVAELQCGNHLALSIIAVREGDRGTEAWLHRQFAHRRRRGEWFVFDEAMLSSEPETLQGAPVDEIRLIGRELLTAAEVEERRKAAGLSRLSLYASARIAHTTYIRWLMGRTEPTMAVYKRIVAEIERAERGEAA